MQPDGSCSRCGQACILQPGWVNSGAAAAVSESSGALSRLGCFPPTDAVLGRSHCEAMEFSVAVSSLTQCCVCCLQEQLAPESETGAPSQSRATAVEGLKLPAVKIELGEKRKALTPSTPPETLHAAVAAQQDASATTLEASIARTHRVGGLGQGNLRFTSAEQSAAAGQLKVNTTTPQAGDAWKQAWQAESRACMLTCCAVLHWLLDSPVTILWARCLQLGSPSVCNVVCFALGQATL